MRCCIRSRRMRRLLQKALVEGGLNVIVPVAAGDEVEEHEQVPYAELRHLGRDLFAGVRGVVGCAADKIHPAPDIRSHYIAEALIPHERIEIILIRQGKVAVDGIHPLDGELHRPAAVQDAGAELRMIKLFHRARHLRKGGKLRVAGEEGEVGHGDYLVLLSYFLINSCKRYTVFDLKNIPSTRYMNLLVDFPCNVLIYIHSI